MAESTPNDKDKTTLPEATEKKTIDKDKLIENGKRVKEEKPEEAGVTGQYGEVAPLKLETAEDAQAKKNHNDGLKAIIVSCIVFALGVTIALIVTINFAPPQVPIHGAVSCDSEVCSNIGSDLLKKGGSAMDAAIGTLFCLSVVQPQSSGLGGGGFMIYRDHRMKNTQTYDFRETTPAGADPNTLSQEDLRQPAALTTAFVGVPGFLKGMEKAHGDYGLLNWEDIVNPSIALARKGFNISKDTAYHLETYVDCSVVQDQFKDTFCRNGKTLQTGDILKLETYANLLEKISTEGASYLYEGPLADEIINTVNTNGGVISKDDFINYEAVNQKPLVINYADYTVESLPAPSGGPLMLFMLRMLDSYKMKPADYESKNFLHRFMEAAKFSNVLAQEFGDPNFNTNVKNFSSNVLSQGFIDARIGDTTDNKTFDISHYFNAIGLQSRKRRSVKHTTHVSVIGPNEDHVAVTNSLNENFGCMIMTPSGIILNNQLLDFDPPDQLQSNNLMKDGARPQSHMAPTVVHSRDRPCGLRLAIGAVGGWSITSEIAYVLANILSFNKTIKEAIETPRVFYDLDSDQFRYESGMSIEVLDELKKYGHAMSPITSQKYHSTVNAVMKINETISGWADSRRGGEATVF